MAPSRIENFLRGKKEFKSHLYSSAFSSVENSPSYISRPVTVMIRNAYEKYMPSSLKLSSCSIITGKEPNEEKVASVLAQTINNKLSKLLRIEAKRIAMQKELAGTLNAWAEEIPSSENQQMIEDYANLIMLQIKFDKKTMEMLEAVKISLTNVGMREKKKKELVEARNKLRKALKDSQLKFGNTASGTVLLGEKLEENSTNLEVVKRQLGRSISTELKEALLNLFGLGEFAYKEVGSSLAQNFQKLYCQYEGSLYSTANNSKQNLALKEFTGPSYDLGVSSNTDGPPTPIKVPEERNSSGLDSNEKYNRSTPCIQKQPRMNIYQSNGTEEEFRPFQIRSHTMEQNEGWS